MKLKTFKTKGETLHFFKMVAGEKAKELGYEQDTLLYSDSYWCPKGQIGFYPNIRVFETDKYCSLEYTINSECSASIVYRESKPKTYRFSESYSSSIDGLERLLSFVKRFAVEE